MELNVFVVVLQPLDVVVNAPFKAYMRQQWSRWFADPEKHFTLAQEIESLRRIAKLWNLFQMQWKN